MGRLVSGCPGLRSKKVGIPKERDRSPRTSFHSD